ncbi:recombinase [Actinomadura sp. LD22]|uniref:Recombinase n=1 Tax=Actinomadura physcomitrii TaxID=2650748 RepID=A0A6I4MVS5_9ACTN|nr:recombinase [Actinomadura physcomitrii]
MNGAGKITASHRARNALVYVRQSTSGQLRRHTESTARQYGLAGQARALGWPESAIVVVDADLGVSGRYGSVRAGFADLVSRVCLGEVGAILGLEVSRLARSSAEFTRLLELARLTGTLLIDTDGVYDIGDVNDRMLLGLKGTMSEAELHLLAGRLHGAKLAAAQRGDLRFPLPIGYVLDSDGQYLIDPDEEIRAAVADVFTCFAQAGSAYRVVGEFTDRKFPLRAYGGAWAGQVRWGRLSHARVCDILANPCYAGTYVYGRSYQEYKVTPDGGVRSARRYRPREQWPLVIHDHHEGYIGWQQFLANEAKLQANRTRKGGRPAREGHALLQGIIVCGGCGIRMAPSYRDQRYSSYQCAEARREAKVTARCRTIATSVVDDAVSELVLATINPGQIKLALKAADEVARRHTRSHRAAELAAERAQYEADRAERAFMQVEPENRLVARTLEKRWETKLAALVEAEAALATARDARPELPERSSLLALAGDLPALWASPDIEYRDRKRLLRTLIADVTIIPTSEKDVVTIGVRWQTGATDQITVGRPGPGRTPAEALEFIAARSATTRDAALAAQLNAAGLTTGRGRPFDAAAVHRARNAAGLRAPWSASACHDGEITIAELSAKLGITRSAVYDWIKAGKLEAHQTPAGRWHIIWDQAVEARCRDMIAASVRLGRRHRSAHSACDGEITAPDLGARLGVNTTVVLDWVHAGKLAAHQTAAGRWHVVWDEAVEARCRDMIASSVRLAPKERGGAGACDGELSIRQLTIRLGIGRGTVLAWIHAGKLAAHQTAVGYWRIPFDESVEARCREWIAASPRLARRQRTQQTSEGGAV